MGRAVSVVTKVVPSSSCRVSAGTAGPLGTGASVAGGDVAADVATVSGTDAVVAAVGVVVSTGSPVCVSGAAVVTGASVVEGGGGWATVVAGALGTVEVRGASGAAGSSDPPHAAPAMPITSSTTRVDLKRFMIVIIAYRGDDGCADAFRTVQPLPDRPR